MERKYDTPKRIISYEFVRPSYSKPKLRPKKLFIFLALFMLAPWLSINSPTHNRIIYAEPKTPEPVAPLVELANVKLVDQLRMPSVSAQETLQTILHQLMPQGTYGSAYAAGQCTWGVASRLPVPGSWGNANTWDNSARAQGYEVETTPKVGAIAVSETDSYWGHVAIVVGTAPLTVWEMNYSGPYSVDVRPANPGEFTNFIYF